MFVATVVEEVEEEAEWRGGMEAKRAVEDSDHNKPKDTHKSQAALGLRSLFGWKAPAFDF